ncbi:MAG: hypothetical protein ACOX4G_15460 [Limnochordia bacterium]|jgi:hypothetical protein
MRAFLAILRRELADAVISPFGQRLATIHLTIASLAVLLGWPISYALGAAGAAPTFAWWVYSEILMLSYLALAIPADIFPIENKIRTGDWIVYGEASIWAIHFGKTCATLLTILFWLITVIPVMLVALAISPVNSVQLASLGLFASLLLATLVQFGTWIGVTIDSQPFRVVSVDVAFVALMLGSILMQTLSGVFRVPIFAQPLEVAARIMNVSAQDVFFGSAAGTLVGLSVPLTTSHEASVSNSISWSTLIVIYGSLFLTACVLSLLSLRQWRERPVKEGDYPDSR